MGNALWIKIAIAASGGDVFLIKMAKTTRRAAAGSKQLSKLNANDMHGQHSPRRLKINRDRVKQNEMEMEMHFAQQTHAPKCTSRRCRITWPNIFYCLEMCVLGGDGGGCISAVKTSYLRLRKVRDP